MKRRSISLATALAGAGAAAVVLAGTSGASHLGSLQLGHANTSTDQTILSANLANPVLKVVNQGSAAALRGDAQNGVGVNGVSVSGTGQNGESQSGIGLLGVHKNTGGINPGVQGTTLSTDPLAAGVLGKNTGGGPGLRAIVNAGAPPLLVNSNAKVASLNADLLDGLEGSSFWKLGGNAGTTPGTDFLGTSDNKALELKVNGQRALRLEPNPTSPNLVGGSSGNSIDSGQFGSVIAGGGTADPGGGNHIENSYDFIGAGYGNQAGLTAGSGASAVVAGVSNVASGGLAFIGAGGNNMASGDYSAVAGGSGNSASGTFSGVGGGSDNTASGVASAVAGGLFNQASGDYSAVAGGYNNTASGLNSAVAGGVGNTASGADSAVPGGFANSASGDFSFAAGTQAKATQSGSFVWGDLTFSDLTAPAANTFTVRASGGIWLGTNSSPSIAAGHFIDTSTGGYLSSAGAWTDASDRALKHGFRPLDKRSVLEKVARMPITSWSYKAEQPSIRHIGPMAQDFYAAFGLGLDDKHIATIDEGGVALAAIKGLYRQNLALQRQNRAQDARLERFGWQNRALRARLTTHERENAALSARLARLEQLINGRKP